MSKKSLWSICLLLYGQSDFMVNLALTRFKNVLMRVHIMTALSMTNEGWPINQGSSHFLRQ